MAKRKPSAVTPRLPKRNRPVDPFTLTKELAEIEFALNPEFLRLKLYMAIQSSIALGSRYDILLPADAEKYITRGFELLGLPCTDFESMPAGLTELFALSIEGDVPRLPIDTSRLLKIFG